MDLVLVDHLGPTQCLRWYDFSDVLVETKKMCHFKNFPYYLCEVYAPELCGQKMTGAIGIKGGAVSWGRYSQISARAKSRTKAITLMLLRRRRAVRWRQKKWLSGVCPATCVLLYIVKSSCLDCETPICRIRILGGQKHLLGMEVLLLWKTDEFAWLFNR